VIDTTADVVALNRAAAGASMRADDSDAVLTRVPDRQRNERQSIHWHKCCLAGFVRAHAQALLG